MDIKLLIPPYYPDCYCYIDITDLKNVSIKLCKPCSEKIIKFIPMKKVKLLKELKVAGKRGSRAGKKLRKIMRKLYKRSKIPCQRLF